MSDDNRDSIDRALAGIERLQRAFLPERMIFVAGGAIALILMTVLSVMMLRAGERDLGDWGPLLGSGGLFMTTSAGAMFYFNKSFDLLRELAKEQRRGE